MVPARTTFHGLYDRSASFRNQPPWNLMPPWVEHKKDLDLDTPLNFVSTADIIGGNSGSPVVNRAGEFVGIIFDGNIESLAGLLLQGRKAPAVAVDARRHPGALRKVYAAARGAERRALAASPTSLYCQEKSRGGDSSGDRRRDRVRLPGPQPAFGRATCSAWLAWAGCRIEGARRDPGGRDLKPV